jgi:predicted Zn-dependent protease with MMP-like domain
MDMTDEQFMDLIEEVMAELPKSHMAAVKNVAIVIADAPTPQQRLELQLNHNQTLFGLYEGVPLARRQGMTGYGPDKITIFKHPIMMHSTSMAMLREEVKHTLWHELAHYFGLNHADIDKIDR